MRALLWLLLLAQAGSFDTTFRAGLAALQQNDLSQAREQLESAGETGKISTEDHRQGLRRYRALFERLLAV